MTSIPVVYTDDPDRHWPFTVTAADGANLDWTPVEAAVNNGGYIIAATWQGVAAPTRVVKVPLASLTLAGTYTVYLKVPGGNDIRLGLITVRDRA